MENLAENPKSESTQSSSSDKVDHSPLPVSAPSPIKQEKLFDEFPTMIGGGGGVGYGDATQDFSLYGVDNFSILKPATSSSDNDNQPILSAENVNSSNLMNFTMDLNDPASFVIQPDSNDSHQVDLDFEIGDNPLMMEATTNDSPSHNLSIKSDDFVNNKSDISFDMRSVQDINDEKFPEMNTSIMSHNETSMSQSDIFDNLDSLENLDKIVEELHEDKNLNLNSNVTTADLVPITTGKDSTIQKDIHNLDDHTPVQLNSSNEISSESSLNDTKIENETFSNKSQDLPLEKKLDLFGDVPVQASNDKTPGDLQYKNKDYDNDYHIGTVQQDNIDHKLQHQEMEFETDHFDDSGVGRQSAVSTTIDDYKVGHDKPMVEEVSTSFSTFTPVFDSTSVPSAELAEEVVLPKDLTSDINEQQQQPIQATPSPDFGKHSNDDDDFATSKAQIVNIQPTFAEEFVVDRPTNVQQFIESPMIDENFPSFGLSSEPLPPVVDPIKETTTKSTTEKTIEFGHEMLVDDKPLKQQNLSDSTEFEKISHQDFDDYIPAPSAPQATIVDSPLQTKSSPSENNKPAAFNEFDDYVSTVPSAPQPSFVEPNVAQSNIANVDDYYSTEVDRDLHQLQEQQQEEKKNDLVVCEVATETASQAVLAAAPVECAQVAPAVDLKKDLSSNYYDQDYDYNYDDNNKPVDKFSSAAAAAAAFTPVTETIIATAVPTTTTTFEAPHQVQSPNYDEFEDDEDENNVVVIADIEQKGTGIIDQQQQQQQTNLLYTSSSENNNNVEDYEEQLSTLAEEEQEELEKEREEEASVKEIEEEEIATRSSKLEGANTLEEKKAPVVISSTSAVSTAAAASAVTRPQQSPPPPPTPTPPTSALSSEAALALAAQSSPSSFSFSSSPTLDTTNIITSTDNMARKNFKRDNSNDSEADSGPDNLKEFLNIVFGPCVAELLYWRDPKCTGPVFALGLIFLFSLSSFSVISVVAYTLFFTLLGTLSFRVYKNVLQAVQKTSEGHPFGEYLALEITPSQERIHEIVDQLLVHVNCLINRFRSVLLVEDIIDSLKYLLIFWSLTYIGAWFNGLTLVILAYLGAFSVPKVYELNKTQIDQYLELACSKINEISDKLPFLKKAPVAEKKED